MALITPIQRAFNGGLWSPRLFGRSDLDAYGTAMSKCVNFIPSVGGHLRRRTGTLYAGATKGTADDVRLLPFVFSATDSLVVELGNEYARFWKNGNPVLKAGVPHEIATPWAGSEVLELDWTQDADTFVVTHRNHQPRLLQRFADDDWRVSTLNFLYGPYLGRGETVPGVIPTSANLNVVTPLWLVTNSGPPAAPLDLRQQNPPINYNFLAKEGPSFAATSIAAFNYERDIDRLILINCYNPNISGVVGDHNSTNDFIDAELAWPIYGKITDVTDAAGTSVGTGNGPGIDVEFYDGYWKTLLAGVPAVTISTQNWFMQALFQSSDGATKEWPSTCTFFEDRLFLAATPLGPDIIYGSRTGTLDDFDLLSASDWPPAEPRTVGTTLQDPSAQAEVLATSGITLGISGNEVAQIAVLRGTQSSLLAGTSRAVYQISAVNQDQTFGPTETVVARPTNAIGATLIGAWAVRDSVFFLLPSEERLFQMGFRLESDSYVANEVSLYNPDIFAQGVLSTAIQLDPEPIYWAVTRTSELVGLTVENTQRVFAFHKHQFGGTDVVVESVATIPNPLDGDDELWIVVRRTVNGSTVRYVEYIPPGYEDGDPIGTQHFVDSGIVDTGGLATISGLSHLEGETVQVQGDGGYIGNFTVVGGQITLPKGYAEVHVGLGFTSEYNSVPLVVNDPQGSNFGKKQRLSQMLVRVARSVGGQVGGGNPGNLFLRQMDERTQLSPIGTALDPVNEVYHVQVMGHPTRQLVYAVSTDIPLNLELVSLSGFVDSSSR